jgi:hypothetical protein
VALQYLIAYEHHHRACGDRASCGRLTCNFARDKAMRPWTAMQALL